ncbi:MAG: hypothetical protein L3J06_06620 [Cyclobacteriaceae bacterium]|nr:hypothetical protein [Cyclobacteriaceae bacterium]
MSRKYKFSDNESYIFFKNSEPLRHISSTESYLQNDMEGLKEEIQQYHPLG